MTGNRDIVDRIRGRINDAPLETEALLDEAAAEIEGLRRLLVEFCTSVECASGCDEGAAEDEVYSNILSINGSALAWAYAKAKQATYSASR